MSNREVSNLEVALEFGSALMVLVGLVGLVGLVFVGLKLRQNTTAVETASVQSLTDALNDFILAIACERELIKTWSTGTSERAITTLDTLRAAQRRTMSPPDYEFPAIVFQRTAQQQSRILLMLAHTKTTEVDEIQQIFDLYQ